MTEAKNFISIIIPVYNGGNTLRDCLDSLFKTSYPDFECIIVDDNSDDDSLEIARSYETKVISLEGQKGAAHARNRGADEASGDILLFIDADVTMYPDCLERVKKAFEQYPDAAAFFGSYDDQPGSQNFLSQYKNLFHHFIHQTSHEEASTFWTACGAIKKDVFFDVGKFNENCRMMEDIELGCRLKAGNHKIRIIKEINVKHLKHYSFSSLIKSDFFDRAIPWTVLILGNKEFNNDLNLKSEHKLSAIVLIISIAFILMSAQSIWFPSSVPVLLALFFYMNREFYSFYLKKRGAFFTLKVVPMHFLYYLYSTLGFIIGHYKYYTQKDISSI